MPTVVLGAGFLGTATQILLAFLVIALVAVVVAVGAIAYRRYHEIFDDPPPKKEAFYGRYLSIDIDELPRKGHWADHFANVDRARLSYVNAHRPDRVEGAPLFATRAEGIMRLDMLGFHWTPEPEDAQCGIEALFESWDLIDCTIEPDQHPVTLNQVPHIVMTFSDNERLIFVAEENEDLAGAIRIFGFRDPDVED